MNDFDYLNVAISGTEEYDDLVDNLEVTNELEEVLSCADSESDNQIVSTIQEFINQNAINKRKVLYFYHKHLSVPESKIAVNDSAEYEIEQHTFLSKDKLLDLFDFVKAHKNDHSFQYTILRIMEKHNMSAPQAYSNARMQRQNWGRAVEFSQHSVTRRLAYQMIIGLHCSLEEADMVLNSAGYLRRDDDKLDLVMTYFIQNKNFDIMAINDVLYDLDMKPFPCDMPIGDKVL